MNVSPLVSDGKHERELRLPSDYLTRPFVINDNWSFLLVAASRNFHPALDLDIPLDAYFDDLPYRTFFILFYLY